MDVAHAVAVVIGGLQRSRHDAPERLLRHAGPVILDGDHERGAVQGGADPDGPLLVGLQHDPVQDGVLDERLCDELEDRAVQQLLRHVDLQAYGVLVAHVLDLDVRAGVLDLVAEPHRVFPAAKAQLVEARQSVDHRPYLLRLVFQRHPVDQVEGVVEEMGIDLCLQRLELELLHLFSQAVLLVDELLDLGDHDVEALGKLADLVPVLRPERDGEIAVDHFFHARHEVLEPPCRGAGHDEGEEHAQRDDEEEHEEHLTQGSGAQPHDVPIGHDEEERPVRVLDTLRADEEGREAKPCSTKPRPGRPNCAPRPSARAHRPA